MNQLTTEQVIQIRDAIFSVVETSSERRAALVESKKIQVEESLSIAEYENNLQKHADALNQLLLNKIVEDMESPAQKIAKATNNLNTAIDKLTAVNKFIDVLSKIANGILTVITTIQSGNPLKLAGLLDVIESLNT